MRVSKSLVVTKWLHLLADFMQFVASICSLALAIYLINTTDPFIRFFRDCLAFGIRTRFQSFLVGMTIFYSAVLSMVAVAGMYGFVRKKWRVLYCYSLIVYLLVLMEILFFVGLVVFQNIYAKSMRTCLLEVLKEEYVGPFTSGRDDITWAFNYLQSRYSCCGLTGVEDYQRFEGWNRSWPEAPPSLDDQPPRAIVPYTCCKFRGEPIDGGPASLGELKAALLDFQCPVNPHENNSFGTVGCFNKLERHVVERKLTFLIVSFTYEVIQCVGIWAAFYSSRVFRRTEKNRKRL